MRELEYAFDIGLKKGLRTHHKNPRNNQALVDCMNIKCTEDGPIPFEPYANPFPDAEQYWPFPQIVEGAVFSFLIVRDTAAQSDKIYEINDDGTVTFVFEVDDATFGTYGGRYYIADFGDYFILTNGEVMIIRDPVEEIYVAAKYTDKIPRCRYIIDLNGQIVGGFVVSDWYGRGAADAVWSKIGEADFTPDEKNTAGFRRMPRGGTILAVHKLGNNAIYYTDKQICALYPVTSPAPTFGLDEVAAIGVLSSGSVGGDDHSQVFIDRYGWLWRITEDKELKKLGYQEYMMQLVANDIVITKDPVEENFYISDGRISYLLTSTGLTKVHQCITSIAMVNGTAMAVYMDTGDREALIVTDTYDFGFRPTKTIFMHELGVDAESPLRLSVLWKNKRQKDFASSGWVPVNDEGAASLIIAGVDFRTAIKCDNYEELFLDYFKVRYKMTDLKTLRGVYAPPPRGQ